MHFMDVSGNLREAAAVSWATWEVRASAFLYGLTDTIADAMDEPIWDSDRSFPPGTRGGMEYAKGYYGAHQAILANLSVDQISWCDVPTIRLHIDSAEHSGRRDYGDADAYP